MTRRRRSTRKRKQQGCLGKQAYGTQDEAVKASGWAMATSMFKVRVYRCVFCKKYHYGHTRQLNETFFERLDKGGKGE